MCIASCLTWYHVVASLITVYLTRYWWIVLRARATLPPGPFPYPVIGNPLGSVTHVSLANLAKKYGDVMTVFNGSNPVVVLSGTRIRECLLKHSHAFSGRPQTYMLQILEAPDNLPGITTLNYCPHLKLYRRLTQTAIRSFIMTESGPNHFEKLASNQAKQLIENFHAKGGKPFNPGLDTIGTVGDIALAMLCGQDNIASYIDRKKFISILSLIRRLTPLLRVNSVFDVFPWLGNIVLTLAKIFSSDMERLLRSISKLLYAELETHHETFDKNNIRDIADAMIKAKDEAEDKNDINKTKMLNDKNLVGALIDLFAAGIITTTTTLEWYFLYMIVHPNIQQKVHDELDRVIGRDRYPTLQDRDKLPYLQATILETLRASSVSPLAAPHETIADIKLNNYTLPSKTTVWINTWSVHHDEKLWPNPNEFSPERHLNNDGTIKASSPNLMPFSCGTRACIGETLAKFNLYIIISHLMQHCTFRKVDNQQLDLSTGSSFVMPCKEYQMIATPRIS